MTRALKDGMLLWNWSQREGRGERKREKSLFKRKVGSTMKVCPQEGTLLWSEGVRAGSVSSLPQC